MAQFDVFRNPDAAQREGFPFLVVIQSDQLDHHSTRLVMPLARLPHKPSREPHRLARAIRVEGELVYPLAHLCAPLPERLLRKRVASLRAESAMFIDALDAILSGV
jgi:toxin CcdB